jgi:hypothetical protein
VYKVNYNWGEISGSQSTNRWKIQFSIQPRLCPERSGIGAAPDKAAGSLQVWSAQRK